MKTLPLLMLLTLLPSPALACIAIPPTPVELARQGARPFGFVQIGYVTGAEYPDYEAALIRDGKSDYPLHGRHIVRITLTESLAGDLSGPVTVETSCYDREPALGARAIVYSINGRTSVLLAAPKYEQELRNELSRLAKR